MWSWVSDATLTDPPAGAVRQLEARDGKRAGRLGVQDSMRAYSVADDVPVVPTPEKPLLALADGIDQEIEAFGHWRWPAAPTHH